MCAADRDARVVVVTGAASGIGAATARRFARDGARVWLADLAVDGARGTAEAIRAEGGAAEAFAIDVADDASVRAAFAAIADRESHVDVVVAAAGVIAIDRFEELSTATWERVLRVNVVGTFLTLQAALPLLRAARSPARVVVVGSAAGKRPGPFTAPYNASKAAVTSLVRTAAAAWAPEVLVNAVAPGIIATPMWRQIDDELASLGATGSEAERASRLPIGRAGSPEEVADVIAFLAGDGGRYLVGEEIDVTGGVGLT